MLDSSIETDIKLSTTEIGKRFMFWNQGYPEGHLFSLSSKLENIGVLEKHDRSIKNKTEVISLSEPTEAFHKTHGPIIVVKVMAHAIMWVSISSLHLMKNE